MEVQSPTWNEAQHSQWPEGWGVGESEGFLPLSLLCTHFSRPCILGLQSQLLPGLPSVLPVAQPVPVPGIMGRDDQTREP